MHPMGPARMEIDGAAEDAWWAWLRAQVGKGYDEIGIAGFIAAALPFLPVPNSVKVQDERTKSAEFFCSELAKASTDQRPHPPLLGTLGTERREQLFQVFLASFLCLVSVDCGAKAERNQ